MLKVSKRIPATQAIIDRLEAAGYDVTLEHLRYEGYQKLGEAGKPLVGETLVSIYKGSALVASGWAECIQGDQFDKSVGTRIAVNRAIHDFTDVAGRRSVKTILQD